MIKRLDVQKEYKVSGLMLEIISEICSIYNAPCIIYTENKVDIIPFPKEQRDYLIGRLVHEFEKEEWEEI